MGDRFAHRVLYSWTTLDQIAELRRNRILLTRSESPKHGASFLDQVLHATAKATAGQSAATGEAIQLAELLYRDGFAKMRFGWPYAWATRAGWPREQYGDQLIRVTLRSDAWIARVSTSAPDIVVHDLDDKPIATADVIAHPERIAAIYFVSDHGQPSAIRALHPFAAFREFALCNESMIEQWEIASEPSARELTREADLLDAIASELVNGPPAGYQPQNVWRGAPTANDPVDIAWAGVIALVNPNYEMTADQVRTLARITRYSVAKPDQQPLSVAPSGSFTLGGPRPAPRVVRDYRDSFARPSATTSAVP